MVERRNISYVMDAQTRLIYILRILIVKTNCTHIIE